MLTNSVSLLDRFATFAPKTGTPKAQRKFIGVFPSPTPARDKPSLRAKTTTIRIRIHRSKRTYSFTFFPNMADMVTQRAFGPRVMCVTVAAVVAAGRLFVAQPHPQVRLDA